MISFYLCNSPAGRVLHITPPFMDGLTEVQRDNIMNYVTQQGWD